MDPILQAKSKLGAVTRYGTPEDQATARQHLTYTMLVRDIERALVAGLTDEQRHQAAALLSSGGRNTTLTRGA